VFDNSVLRKTFGPKRKEVTGDWRKHHNEGLHDFYCSAHIGVLKPEHEQCQNIMLRK
jgi:hypothetical protein